MLLLTTRILDYILAAWLVSFPCIGLTLAGAVHGFYALAAVLERQRALYIPIHRGTCCVAAAHSRHHVPDALQPCGIRVDVLYRWARQGLEPRKKPVQLARQPHAGPSLLEARIECRARLAKRHAQFLRERQSGLEPRTPRKLTGCSGCLLVQPPTCVCLAEAQASSAEPGQATCRARSPSTDIARRVHTAKIIAALPVQCCALRMVGGSRACGSGSAHTKLCMMRRVVYTERRPSGCSSSAPSAIDASSTSSRRAPPGAAMSWANLGAACTSWHISAMTVYSLP